MQKGETRASLPPETYQPHDLRDGQEAYHSTKHDLYVVKEWERIQMQLLDCVFTASLNETCSWRHKIETALRQVSGECAQIWWEPLSNACTLEGGQLLEIRYQHIRYGMLKLTPGYLISHLFPDIPQTFAHLCALLITFIEHRTLVESLLKTLSPLDVCGTLTAREQDVLKGMACGESETVLAQRLCIALTTVRTHRQHVYQCLHVATPKDAVLRSFELRLLNWLDLS